jgi:hypothetical protein
MHSRFATCPNRLLGAVPLFLVLLFTGAFEARDAQATTTTCRCACRLGAVNGFHEVCNKTYKSIDNGGYYCYDAGWDFKVQVNGTIDACMGLEDQAIACAGWLVKTDDWFDNDPLYPIPATPVWLTGTLDVCIAD